jgi:hypothetical protein
LPMLPVFILQVDRPHPTDRGRHAPAGPGSITPDGRGAPTGVAVTASGSYCLHSSRAPGLSPGPIFPPLSMRTTLPRRRLRILSVTHTRVSH